MTGPRPLAVAVQKSGALSAMPTEVEALVPSRRATVTLAGPGAQLEGTTKLAWPQPAAAYSIAAFCETPELSMMRVETSPSSEGGGMRLLHVSRSAKMPPYTIAMPPRGSVKLPAAFTTKSPRSCPKDGSNASPIPYGAFSVWPRCQSLSSDVATMLR